MRDGNANNTTEQSRSAVRPTNQLATNGYDQAPCFVCLRVEWWMLSDRISLYLGIAIPQNGFSGDHKLFKILNVNLVILISSAPMTVSTALSENYANAWDSSTQRPVESLE